VFHHLTFACHTVLDNNSTIAIDLLVLLHATLASFAAIPHDPNLFVWHSPLENHSVHVLKTNHEKAPLCHSLPRSLMDANNDTPSMQIDTQGCSVMSVANVTELVTQLQEAREQMAAVFRVALDANNQRHINCVRETTQTIKRSLETGSHALAVVGLTSLINAQEEMRSDWNSHTMHAYRRLENLVESVGGCVERLCDQIGIMPPSMPPSLLQDTVDPPLRKRARIANPVETPFPDVIDGLRDRNAAFEQLGIPQLSAASCALLDTVVTESALCPDICALRDVYHPRTCLYAVEDDRRWLSSDTPTQDVHLGFYTATMLVEFCCHRDQIRRFTMAHLLAKMGFGTPDLHGMIAELDETFYRRVLSEPRLSFLAEGHSPKLTLFAGTGWARLWDLFLGDDGPRNGTADGWAHSPLAEELAEDMVTELESVGSVGSLPLSTVLGALHRQHSRLDTAHGGGMAMPEMTLLHDTEVMFLDGVAQIPHGLGRRILALGDAYNGMARGWPIVLRQSAVRHIRHRVTRLYTVPNCSALMQTAHGCAHETSVPIHTVAEWLVVLSKGEASENEHAATHALDVCIGSSTVDERRVNLVRRMQPLWTPVYRWPNGDTYELSEEQLHCAVEQRYGNATEAHWSKSRLHLDNLARLVQEATRHGTEYWTDGKRHTQQHLPDEVLNGLQQRRLCLSSDEYRTQCMRQLLDIIQDPLADGSAAAEAVLGESQMRPATLYPDAI
jgi:hypothetical protein